MDNEDLKELNAIFKDMGGVEKVEEYTNNFENLPDGDYIGEIEKFETTKEVEESGSRGFVLRLWTQAVKLTTAITKTAIFKNLFI